MAVRIAVYWKRSSVASCVPILASTCSHVLFETNLKGSKDQTKETSIRTRVKVTNQTWGLRGVWNLFISFIKCKPHGKCWHWQEQDTTPGIGMDSVVCLKRGYPKFFCWILTHPLGLPFKGSVYGIVRYSNQSSISCQLYFHILICLMVITPKIIVGIPIPPGNQTWQLEITWHAQTSHGGNQWECFQDTMFDETGGK